MIEKPKSNPELIFEAEVAKRETSVTIGLGEAILQQAREIICRMTDRFRRVTNEDDTEVEEREEGVCT